MVLSAEIAAAIPHRGPCGLDQRGTQPSVAFARAPAAALAGALMVARADPRPGGGLRGRWEAPHVVPELGGRPAGRAGGREGHGGRLRRVGGGRPPALSPLGWLRGRPPEQAAAGRVPPPAAREAAPAARTPPAAGRAKAAARATGSP